LPRNTPQPHIHRDVDVTSGRLDAFALAPRAEQAVVLARLRAQSADTSGTAVLSLVSLLVAVLLVIAAPLITVEIDPSLQGNVLFATTTMVALIIVLLVFFIPGIVEAAKDAVRKERAAVWLGAYQDELARRHLLRGRRARRWQRSH
jgi:protein-S-isoprenylcysteine O-methyltransferase Ste14